MKDIIKRMMRSICNDCVTIINTDTNTNIFKRHDFDVDYISGIGRCRKCNMILIMDGDSWNDGDLFIDDRQIYVNNTTGVIYCI